MNPKSKLFSHSQKLKDVLLLLRLARRDLRSGTSTLLVSSICITLSVFLIVFISSVSQSITTGLKFQGKSILGGDVAFTTVHRDLGESEKKWLAERAEISPIALTRTMGRSGQGRNVLVEVKAVDDKYPLIGELRSSPSGSLKKIFSLDDRFGAIVERDLLSRLNLSIGDSLLLGDRKFKILSFIDNEPDNLSNGISFGPRAIISLDAARESGLVQDGSLTRWVTRASLPNWYELNDLVSEFRLKFPDANWQARTHENSVPSLNRALERFRVFLTVSCVLVLLVGGIGVSNSIRLFVERRAPDFATLRALGASESFVLCLSFMEIAIVALLCSGLGALIGSVCAYFSAFALSGFFHMPVERGFFAKEVFGGVLIGLLGALSFSIAPLARIGNLSTRAILGHLPFDFHAPLHLRHWIFITAGLLITTLSAAQTLIYSLVGVLMLVGAVFCLLFLGLVGDVTRILIRKLPRPNRAIARLVFINMTSPGHLTRSIITTFGLGMLALSSFFILESNVRVQFSTAISTQSPDLFLLDIPLREGETVKDIIKKHAPQAGIEMTPMMRGRLVRINGTAISNKNVSENVAWVLDGDRGITFASALPKNSRIVEGQWWDSAYAGEPLVSIDANIAKGLNASIGDVVTMNVMGREISARISSLRNLEWNTLGLNFVFVFSPNTFSGAPFMQTAAVRLQANREVQQQLIQDLSQELPHLVTIQVREAFEKLSFFVRQLRSIGVGLTLILFALATLVLGSALAANQETRVYAAAIFVALGASRRSLLFAFALEFVLLGLLAAVIGALLGTGASWILLHRLVEPAQFSVPVGALLWATLIVVAIVSLLGLTMTRQKLESRLGTRLKQGH